MKSKSFVRYSKKDKQIMYTPVFTKNFIDPGSTYRPISSPKNTNDDINDLRAERLKAFWELLSYEELYSSKKSIKARVGKILEAAKMVKVQSKTVGESIGKDREWIRKIEEMMGNERKNEMKIGKKQGHASIAWQDFWVVERVGGELGCFLVKVHTIKMKVRVHAGFYGRSFRVVQEIEKEPRIGGVLKMGQSEVLEFIRKEIVCKLEITRFSSPPIPNSNFLNTFLQPQHPNTHFFPPETQILFISLVINSTPVSLHLFYHPGLFAYKLDLVFQNQNQSQIKSINSITDTKYFQFISNLQFTHISECTTTFIKSLELDFLIKLLINS